MIKWCFDFIELQSFILTVRFLQSFIVTVNLLQSFIKTVILILSFKQTAMNGKISIFGTKLGAILISIKSMGVERTVIDLTSDDFDLLLEDVNARKKHLFHKHHLYLDSLPFRSKFKFSEEEAFVIANEKNQLMLEKESQRSSISSQDIAHFINAMTMVLLVIFFLGMIWFNERRWNGILKKGFPYDS